MQATPNQQATGSAAILGMLAARATPFPLLVAAEPSPQLNIRITWTVARGAAYATVEHRAIVSELRPGPLGGQEHILCVIDGHLSAVRQQLRELGYGELL